MEGMLNPQEMQAKINQQGLILEFILRLSLPEVFAEKILKAKTKQQLNEIAIEFSKIEQSK